MNPLLAKLQPYPFERLKQLFASVTPNPAYRAISLGIGEPKHATPPFLQQAMAAAITSPIASSGASSGLAAYPATGGDPRCANPSPTDCSGVTTSSSTRPPRCCP